jgi:hypothetical protein
MHFSIWRASAAHQAASPVSSCAFFEARMAHHAARIATSIFIDPIARTRLLRWILGSTTCVALCFYDSGACAEPLIRTVALSGRAAPDAQGAMFRSFDRPQINNLGHVAFTAQQMGPGIDPPRDGVTARGLWSEGFGGDLRLVARNGSPTPGTNGNIFGSPFLHEINDAGQVVFESNNFDGAPNRVHGPWILRNSTQLDAIIRRGDPVPWVNDARFSGTGLFGPYLNENGKVVFTEYFSDEPVTYIRSDVLEWSNGSLRSLGVTEGMDLGINGVTASSIEDVYAGEEGDVAFVAYLQGAGVTFDNNLALCVRSRDGGIRLIAREGDVPPGVPNSRFVSSYLFGIAAPSRFGMATIIADLEADAANRGIWSERGGNGLELIAKTGDPVIGENGITLHPWQMRTNDFGRVALYGGLAGAEGTPESNSALMSDGLTPTFQIVARRGSPVPGVATAVFQEFIAGEDEFHINNFGQLMFWARVAGQGISSTNDEGLWAQDRNGELQMIVREGMTIDVDNGITEDLRTVWMIDRRGLHRFNDRGQIVFAVRFTDGTSGVFVSNAVAVPEPNSLGQAVLGISASAVVLCWGRNRRRR